MPSRASDDRTLLESALKHEGVVTATLIVLFPVLCWTWIALMAHDMYGTMLGPSAWMMTGDWDVPHLLLLWAMWAVMMTAMMLPSASPLVLLYAGALRTRGDLGVGRKMYAMAAGYLVVWGLFSVAATVLQRLLSTALVLTPMMEPATHGAAAVVLAVAGLYQLTPLKRTCLRACRSPLSYLMQHGRPGTLAAFKLGARHGAYCLGCCWALMLLLFAGGIMNLVVIVVLTLWVLVEKFAPFGEQTPKASGMALLAAALWTAVR